MRSIREQHPSVAEEIRELFPTLIARGSGSDPRLEPEGTRRIDLRFRRKLGNSPLCARLLEGGMGIVYEAIQQSLGRRVALKVLPLPDAANEMQLARFRREAQAVAQLHHTNIVPVFGIGEDRGLHFYAMQFIQGQTLGSRSARAPKTRRLGVAGFAGTSRRSHRRLPPRLSMGC